MNEQMSIDTIENALRVSIMFRSNFSKSASLLGSVIDNLPDTIWTRFVQMAIYHHLTLCNEPDNALLFAAEELDSCELASRTTLIHELAWQDFSKSDPEGMKAVAATFEKAVKGANEQKITFSETFLSFQGEGHYTGVSTAWVRLFACNLQCNGFGQEDPTDPSTYELPFKDFDASSVTSVEQLPVWNKGCDSSYTWSKKFKHLMHEKTAVEICNDIEQLLKDPTNPEGKFEHPLTHQVHHMAFTGGEPLLPKNQQAIVDILEEFQRRGNLPPMVTIETNGTQKITNLRLKEIITQWYDGGDREWFWSVSPKLWSTSGERPSKAIVPEAVEQYAELSDYGQLKYVVNGTSDSWLEVETNTRTFRRHGISWNVWIMPVGATKEQQEEDAIANIAIEALKKGYYFSGRLHAYVFGNKIGT